MSAQAPTQQRKVATPSTLASFKDVHKGETIIVCGCGESLNLLGHPERFVTIGVNDIGRRFHPNYLVVVNPRSQFSGDRFRYVETSRARYLFSQYDDLRVPHPELIKVQLGTRGGTEFSNPNVLHFTQNSPYVALCLAIHMGAKRIWLIGVDFTEAHFFGKIGTHPLAGRLGQIDREYGALAQACRAMDVELVNLSPMSRLTTLPRVSLSWAADPSIGKSLIADRSKGLRIVSYATTPVAGVPAILARCISAVTDHSARCVWATDGYGNGVEFVGDVQWKRQPEEALELLKAADVVIVHNGKVDPAHSRLLNDKPVVTMAHNYGWNVDTQFVECGQPGVVVGQYQATLPEFAHWAVVPNPIPLWEPEYRPSSKDDQITIAFTPSGRHERYPTGHRLYWHGKGFETTMRVLERLARRSGVRIETTSQHQISHAQALAMKRRAHIVIDECVTGSYHRNSLEGLAAACVVVNGLGIAVGVREAILKCAGACPDWLFVPARLDNLEGKLDELVALGVEELREQGRCRRAWMESHWNFETQWEIHWSPAIDRALNRTWWRKKGVVMRIPQSSLPDATDLVISQAADSGLSVVVPFGGRERLELLEATVSGLRQSAVVDQVIIVELGRQALALDIARRWSADYLFISLEGMFNKARALNAGSVLARNPEILWCDGDLLFNHEFLARAQREFRARRLDFLFPFSRIEYLGEGDSKEVRAGTRSPFSCRAMRILKPMREVPGGLGLVRAELLRSFGGMIEGFLGWGGEDNAWVHKASLVGRVGVTQRSDQTAWHLFHSDSGAAAGKPLSTNPHYASNLKLLDEVRRIKTAAELQRRFPPPVRASTPWSVTARLCFVVIGIDTPRSALPLAKAWSQCLANLYGISVPVLNCSPADLEDTLSEREIDAIVAFPEDETSCRAFARAAKNKVAILVLGQNELNAECLAELIDVPCVLACTREQVEKLRANGVWVWHAIWGTLAAESPGTPPIVVQPLSLLLGDREIAEVPATLHPIDTREGIPMTLSCPRRSQ